MSTDSIAAGKEAAAQFCADMLAQSGTHTEKAMFWAGVLSAVACTMGADVGGPPTAAALGYLADHIEDAIHKATVSVSGAVIAH